jgi:hypothetical protein
LDLAWAAAIQRWVAQRGIPRYRGARAVTGPHEGRVNGMIWNLHAT